MKILITGATGLVGKEIVKLCHQQNISVNYLTTQKSKIVNHENYKGFYWNPEKTEIDFECFTNITAIINLAGASISKRWTASYKRQIISSRINSLKTLNIGLSKINASNIKSIISASAIGVYPNSIENVYYENERLIDDSFLGEVVQAWEQEINMLFRYNIPIGIIRIGLVLSDKGGALPEMIKPIKNYIGASFGSGKQWQSWIHISDLAKIFLFAVENQLDDIYNGVAPNPVSNAVLTSKIAKVLGRPLLLPNIPKFAMKTVLGEMAYLLFASQNVSSKKIEEENFAFDYPTVDSALADILS